MDDKGMLLVLARGDVKVLFAHLPSLLFDWSSPRNVVPPFFTMCLSMSTAAQL